MLAPRHGHRVALSQEDVEEGQEDVILRVEGDEGTGYGHLVLVCATVGTGGAEECRLAVEELVPWCIVAREV
jgi:hypothetical protein